MSSNKSSLACKHLSDFRVSPQWQEQLIHKRRKQHSKALVHKISKTIYQKEIHRKTQCPTISHRRRGTHARTPNGYCRTITSDAIVNGVVKQWVTLHIHWLNPISGTKVSRKMSSHRTTGIFMLFLSKSGSIEQTVTESLWGWTACIFSQCLPLPKAAGWYWPAGHKAPFCCCFHSRAINYVLLHAASTLSCS